MTKRLSLCVFTLLILLPFQNCSFTGDGYSSANPSKSRSSLSGSGANVQLGGANGGQPYDGKPYVLNEPCSDGTVVKSRLVLKGDAAANGGTLYRENCQSESPRQVSAQSIAIHSKDPDRLTFEGQVYSAERPAIPLPGMVPWYYQLQGTLQSRPPSIYLIDMFDSSAATIQNLKMAGHTVICVMSAGTVENWRPDANQFTAAETGRRVSGAADERWIDTRSGNVRSIMRARMDLAKSKGCHGINFDSVDGYANNTGFSLTTATQLEYNQYLAFAAHDRELILSLNNAPELAPNLSIPFDFAIAEQCFEFGECDRYSEFIKRGKPVLAAEYTAFSQAQCNQAAALQISLAYFSPQLDGSRYQSCF
jgi:hypothetical protein